MHDFISHSKSFSPKPLFGGSESPLSSRTGGRFQVGGPPHDEVDLVLLCPHPVGLVLY